MSTISERPIYVDSRLEPQAVVGLFKMRWTPIDIRAVPLDLDPSGVIIAEGESGARRARNFTRPRDPLAMIVRPRYFAVSAVPVRDAATLRGNTLLLPPLPGDAELSLGIRTNGPVTVRFNGRVLERAARARVLSRTNAPNEVEVNGGTIVSYGWIPAF